MSARWLALFTSVSMVLTPLAQANPGPLNASAVSPSSIQSQAPSCDDICPLLVGAHGTSNGGLGSGNDIDPNNVTQSQFKNGSSFGGTPTSGGGTAWSSAADQWCANHGFPTDITVTPTATPTPVAAGSPCNVPTFAGESCSDNNNKILQCEFHGSQLEAYCMAYEAGNDAGTLNAVVLALDIAAAVVCANACFAIVLSAGTAQTACTVASLAASLSEIVGTMTQQSSSVGQQLTSWAGGLGASAAAITGSVQQAGASQPVMAAGTSADDVPKNTSGDTAACISAALLAVMAGIRVADILGEGESKSDACKHVQSLWSSAASSTPAGTTANPAQTVFNPQTGAVTSGGPGGAAGGSNGSVTGSTPIPTIPPGGLGPVAAGSTGTAATDSGLLNNSGMDRSLAPAAQHLLDNGLQNALRQGAGAALGSALGASGGDLGSGLAALAQAGQDHAAELGGSVGGGSYAGGGGGGGGKSSDAGNPFGGLFGGGGGAAAVAGNKSAEFGSRSPASDIWHTGTTLNLFEIVSGKIEKVLSRVTSR